MTSFVGFSVFFIIGMGLLRTNIRTYEILFVCQSSMFIDLISFTSCLVGKMLGRFDLSFTGFPINTSLVCKM